MARADRKDWLALLLPHYAGRTATLGSIKGKAIVTLNDHPAIRELFGRFHVVGPTPPTPSAAALRPST